MTRLVREQPETFSPNVLLRPIVQDTLFPTVAYVSGPNELGYLGQLRDVYERFDVPMPLIYPRLSATVLDRGAVKFLTRHDIGLEQLQARDDGVLNGLINAHLPVAVETAVTAAERQAGETMDAVADLVTTIDPTLAGAARTTKQRMERESAHPARQDRPGGQAARHNPATAVPAHPGAGVSARRAAGARRLVRLFHQPPWPRGNRPPA